MLRKGRLTDVAGSLRWMSRPFRVGKAGFSLIEIILVIALIGTLMTYLITKMTNLAETAREDQAGLAMKQLEQPLQIYKMHNSRYPTTDQGLDALVQDPGSAKNWRGPYLENEAKLNDPWGNRLDYESNGYKFQMRSAGRKGVLGDGDDVLYPKPPKDPQDNDG